ncbi:hypothetical protein W97_00990 [Coniosporium apollinis CBS 100218]|uniref:PSP proline-rich domain-containing protein n=1 Tax=Coniosporium apollinis (strain CBS 100218) TaxID=1168221 RepID=R7YIZ7_CONA1|nr:uncharacterized protein W97_00990 [Coniosporium apollinis CBS 100218]EON61774.1 hypothetical protein W97_00990 [Coniosporium apollinis CBS 100218]
MPGAVAKQNQTKNQRRRAKEKAKKLEARSSTPMNSELLTDGVQASQTPAPETPATETAEPPTPNGAPEITAQAPSESETDNEVAAPVSEPAWELDVTPDNPLYEQFKDVIAKFQQPDKEDPASKEPEKPEIYYDDENEDIPDEDEEAQPKLSKKARKAQSKLSIAELKALVQRPDLVDWTDTSAPDPRLLVSIKSYRNVVPVPAHWSLKREYLSSKRGVEKAPFALPKFIQETGIAEMRDAVLEKQDQASLKQKQRERVQPKMGKLDIDYQKLYEAFFRFQTKPELTRYGEVYYEGKEYETNLRHLRPGELSEELKEALNIPPGAPPPWLINQQRFGPPPSYPSLKIPGLNAPPPPGGQWGFHPGGYGKPPVDELNRPLYGGDVFGTGSLQQQPHQTGEPVEKTLWGELQPPEEESEEEEEEEDEEEEGGDEEDAAAGLQTPSGLETPSGMASTVPSEFGGAESVAGEFTLRKQRRGTETEESTHPRSAYQVLPEHSIRAQGFFGGERAYDLKAAQQNLPVLGQDDNRRKRKAGDVDVSVDVDALEREDRLSKDEVRRQFESSRQEQKNPWGTSVDQDDLSQMIADESRKRLKKDEERRGRR